MSAGAGYHLFYLLELCDNEEIIVISIYKLIITMAAFIIKIIVNYCIL